MKMPRLFKITLAFLLIGLVFSGVLPALAATVTFRVASVQASAGGTVDVPIEVIGAPGLGALHLELVYDPKVVTPDTVSRGPLAGSNALVDFNPAKPGQLAIGVVTLDAIKGDGVVATVRFKVVGAEGTSSALTLENSKAWESGTHAEVLIKTEAGKVTVGGGFPIWIVGLVCAGLAMLLLLGIFLFFMLRRRSAPQPASVQPAYYPTTPAATLPRAPGPSAPSPQMTACPHCGAQISANAQFCKVCSKSIAAKPTGAPRAGASPAKRKCPACGAALSKTAQFCKACGAAVTLP